MTGMDRATLLAFALALAIALLATGIALIGA